MAPTKKKESAKVDTSKKVRFTKKDSKDENMNILKVPTKENYPIKSGLNLDED